MLSSSSQVPDKILFSLSAYSDKTLFSYISTPNGKGETLLLVLFWERHIFCQGSAKQGKEEQEENRRKKKKSYCILDKEMRK